MRLSVGIRIAIEIAALSCTTAHAQLVFRNGACLRLHDLSDVPWHDRSLFFAIASRIMRRIVVDHPRAQT